MNTVKIPIAQGQMPPPSPAESALITLQERPTPARVAVLNALIATPTALTHLEIAAATQTAGSTLDRVTLYRVLDWLVDKGLAHKIAGEDRVWRFNAMTPNGQDSHATHEHAHFHCSQCGWLYCLDDLHPVFAFVIKGQRVPASWHKCNSVAY